MYTIEYVCKKEGFFFFVPLILTNEEHWPEASKAKLQYKIVLIGYKIRLTIK